MTDAPDGLLFCSGIPGRECPMGYYCEPLSNSCWRNGDVPDLSLSNEDFGPPVPFPTYILTIPLQFDLSMPDMSMPDLTPPTD